MSTGERTLSPRERAMLSALIVQAGAGVPADQLADAYWGEDVPATWAQQVKTSIARIRAALGADSVRTISGGYALGLDPDLIDAMRFERLVSAARSHTLRGETDRALDVYTRALGLWRGAAYPDVANWPAGAAEAARIGEIRMAAEEEALECRLALGEHRAVIAEAERLVRAAPLREERWAILALANYRTGRQAEALAALRSARTRLSDELGIDLGHRLTELETAILRQDPSLDAPQTRPAPSADCPYQGLEAFGVEDADEFFGRDVEAGRILERLRPGSLLALAGASGSGKSSVAMAGVLRRLIDRGTEAHVLRPGQLSRLEVVTASGVVLVDQFEELFQLDGTEIDRQVGALDRYIREGGTVLVTVRSDFLDRCLARPDLAELFSDRVVPVLPMSRQQLQEVIERPAERAGLRIEPGLTELILRDAADHPAALPLLSYALAETWMRREAGVLTVEGYTTAGGLAGAVANSAEKLYQSWDAAEQGACRALMLRLVERGLDGSTVRRVVPLRGLEADPVRSTVISALGAARLLTIDDAGVAISHETLVAAWPRLADWIIEDAEDAQVMAAIASATDAWVADGRSEDDLLHGARLQAAIEWQAVATPDLTPDESDFLAASQIRAEKASREIEERAARDRRQNRRLRWAVIGAAVLLVAAIAGGGLAAVRGGEAEAAAEEASVEALVATSLSLLESERDTAALLAAEAFRRWPDDPRVRAALWGVVRSGSGLIDMHRDDQALMPWVDMIPDTNTAVRVSAPADRPDQPTLGIIDVTTGEVLDAFDLRLPEAAPHEGSSVAVSPDGSRAAVRVPVYPDPSNTRECCWSHVAVVDLTTGETLLRTGPIRASILPDLQWDSAGEVLYTAEPATAHLIAIDTTSGGVRASSNAAFTDHPGTVSDRSLAGVALVDDDLIAVGAGDHIRIHDRETLALTRTIPLDGNRASEDIIADRQGGLVTTGWDGTARVVVATGEILWRRFLDQTRNCVSLHLASDKTVACGSYHGVDLLRLATGESTGIGTRLGFAYKPWFEAIDNESLLVFPVDPPVWLRWRIDGGGAGADVVAKGRELVDGPEHGGSLVVTQPIGGGPAQLWDLEHDAPIGAESARIVLLGSGVIARFVEWQPVARMIRHEQLGDLRLERVSTGEEITLRIPDLPSRIGILPGSRGRVAFVWWPDGIVAFDPGTGEPLGPLMTVPGEPLNEVISTSETPDSKLAVITWEQESPGGTETGVFDIATGELLVRGLYDLNASRVIDGDQFVGIGEYARRYDIDTLKPVSVLPRALNGASLISLSSDGRTLLNVGFNNALMLYDLRADIALAGPLDGAVDATRLPGGFLASDGESLLEALPDGIRIWDLRPAQQALHACALAGHELQDEEWSTYFPGEEQVDTCAVLRAGAIAADE